LPPEGLTLDCRAVEMDMERLGPHHLDSIFLSTSIYSLEINGFTVHWPLILPGGLRAGRALGAWLPAALRILFEPQYPHLGPPPPPHRQKINEYLLSTIF
jgi:hypothetical protein